MSKHTPKLMQPKAGARRRGQLCSCTAYPWSHRPGGGLCRWPALPNQQWSGAKSVSKPTGARADRGVRRRLVRMMGWHPVRDRKYILRWLPKLYIAYSRRRGFTHADAWLDQNG